MTKAQATRRGRALLKQMRGKHWRLDVWENLGWHCAVENNAFRVTTNQEGYTTAFMLRHDSIWGSPVSDRDPNRAVVRLLRQACQRLDDYKSTILLAKWELG